MRASDSSQPVARRLESLQLLRAYGQAEPYLCTEEVVVSMLQLADETNVPAVRADIFRQLNGLDYSIMGKPLSKALLNDKSSEVREEAARTLRSLREDPEVQSALNQAKAEDESERVRMQAEASLAGENTAASRSGIASKGDWESEQ